MAAHPVPSDNRFRITFAASAVCLMAAHPIPFDSRFLPELEFLSFPIGFVQE